MLGFKSQAFVFVTSENSRVCIGWNNEYGNGIQFSLFTCAGGNMCDHSEI
jgi:hypothetical protein